jgi:hypothetical protein
VSELKNVITAYGALRDDYDDLIADRDALKARVEKLERTRDAHKAAAAYWAAECKRIKGWADAAIESVADASDSESGPLKARVDLLTAALTGLVSLKDGPRDENYRAHKDAAWARARTLVAEHTTEPIPLNEFGSVPLSYVFRNLPATPTEPLPLKASQIPTEPGVPSKRVSPGSRSYWAAIHEAESTPTTESETP